MSTDDTLAQILASGPVTDIPAVLQRMGDIEEALPYTDGLKWFTMLYRAVTEQVLKDVEAGLWADTASLIELDVKFASLYFDAIQRWLTDRRSTPRAWVPLFEARHRTGIAEIQYELAGMNAHINRDLPVAVLQTCLKRGAAPIKGSPQHRDFLRVNELLARVEAAMKQTRGLLQDIAKRLETLDDVLAMWSVAKARDSAWTHAEVLWSLQPVQELAGEYLTVLDRTAGFAGRGLLVRASVGASGG